MNDKISTGINFLQKEKEEDFADTMFGMWIYFGVLEDEDPLNITITYNIFE
jgi:hypothetical protein